MSHGREHVIDERSRADDPDPFILAKREQVNITTHNEVRRAGNSALEHDVICWIVDDVEGFGWDGDNAVSLKLLEHFIKFSIAHPKIGSNTFVG